ncbi:MAG: YebC/PmpR family DNA-binding transcriptional regulator [Leptolyngbya sp. PLA3]|nr:MAG: YebC/PmpR family DNA-binding transcriptional regulator [Cyanobacteria bacterium CYA]MCE7968595.1 YebC/PmpR family DNA-binding transcriptional regulator [Leptolyngbya sp. PL-A3]
MAGHSKWANIKHRKAKQDQKRGKVWTKCSKAIIVAARAGGGDPDTNLSLRYAIDEAKYANMPKDTIQRAIDKGAGAGGGENFEAVSYEGFGPGGAALIIDGLTDNKTRTVTDVRNAFKKYGGNLGTTGSVSFMFKTKGQIILAGSHDENTIMEKALDAGAEDVQAPQGEDGAWVIITEVSSFQQVKEAFESGGIEIAEAAITKIPNDQQLVGEEDARKLLALIDALEDSDDIQKVYSNADISDEAALG